MQGGFNTMVVPELFRRGKGANIYPSKLLDVYILTQNSKSFKKLQPNPDLLGGGEVTENAYQSLYQPPLDLQGVPVFPESVARWQFSARDGATMPYQIFQDLQSFDLERQVVIGVEPCSQLGMYKQEVEAELLPFAKRRIAEQALAAYIADQVIAVADVAEFQRLEGISAALASCRTGGDHAIAVNLEKKTVSRRVIWDKKCGLPKLCPDESRFEGARIAERYLPAVLEWQSANSRQRRVFYAVLTMPNFEIGSLHDGKRLIYKDWVNMLERVRHNPSVKAAVGDVHGALVCQEDPLSARGDWNVHLNVVLLVEGPLSFEALRAEWGWNLEIKQIQNGNLAKAFKEVCKYQAKATSVGNEHAKTSQPGMVDWPPSAWLEWWRANDGFRRTRSYGCLFNIEEPEIPKDKCKIIRMGRMTWDKVGKKYIVEVYERALEFVDLIQGDKSGISRLIRSGKFGGVAESLSIPTFSDETLAVLRECRSRPLRKEEVPIYLAVKKMLAARGLPGTPGDYADAGC